MNERGEVAVHGETVSVWTTKIPSEGARAVISDLVDVVKDKLS